MSAVSCFRCAAAIGIAATLALPASAQSREPSLLDLIRPERLVQRAIQFGIMGLRTQMEVTYGGISVNVLTGSVTLTNVALTPRLPYETDSPCTIHIDRLALRSAAVDEVDLVRLKLQATGATAPFACLPPDVSGGISFMQVDNLILSRVTMDLSYRISTGAAEAHLLAVAEGLAAVSAEVDFDYLWAEQRNPWGDPTPVGWLNSARVTVENRGLWQMVTPLLPPPFTDPATAEFALGGLLDMAFPIEIGGEAQEVYDAFHDSAIESWTAFLANPSVLVLETGIEPGNPVFIDFEEVTDSPDAFLLALQPVVARQSSKVRTLVSAALVDRAISNPAGMSAQERLQVGIALATGVGAPRDVVSARAVLEPLVAEGDGQAAAALADALEGRDPAAAYQMALVAAANGEVRAMARLDRIEAVLPFDQIRAIQAIYTQGDQSADTLDSVATVRAEAAMRMNGVGRTRSYELAHLWALICAAAGDGECAGIIDDLDEMVRLGGPTAASVWSVVEAQNAESARSAWVGFDLPASYGGR